MRQIVLLMFVLGVGAGRAQVAYVGTSSNDLISTLNEATGAQTAVAKAGYFGANFALSPDATKAYVQSYNIFSTQPSSILVVDLATGSVTGAITTVSSPGRPALSPDGSTLYVFSYSDGTLAALDTASGSLLASVPVGYLNESLSQGYIAVKPDGSEVYVAVAGGIMALDAQSLAVKATIPSGAQALAFSTDGGLLYGVSRDSDTMLSAIDTTSYSVIAEVHAPASAQASIEGLAVSPDNHTIYIAAIYQLLVVSTDTYEMVAHYQTPLMGASLSVSQDGAAVYATRYAPTGSSPSPGLVQVSVPSGTATVIDAVSAFAAISRPAAGSPLYLLGAPPSIVLESAADGTVIQAIGPAYGSTALAVSSSGNVVAGLSAYNSYLNSAHVTVSLIDTTTHKSEGAFNVAPFVPLGDGLPGEITLTSDGSVGYVTSFEGSSLMIEALKLPEGTVENTFAMNASYPGIGSLVISPDDSTLYFSETGSICSMPVAAIGTATCSGVGGGKIPDTPQSYTLSPDGGTIYLVAAAPIKNGYGSYLFVDEIDAKTFVTKTSISIPYSDVGPYPYGARIAYAAGTNSAYVACEIASSQPYSGVILRVDLNSPSVAAVTHFGYAPTGLAVTPDGSKALVTGSNYGTQIFDGTTLAATGLIPGGPGQGIVLAPQ